MNAPDPRFSSFVILTSPLGTELPIALIHQKHNAGLRLPCSSFAILISSLIL
jgi:hypothetical protein